MKDLWISVGEKLPDDGDRVLVFAPKYASSLKTAIWWRRSRVWDTDIGARMAFGDVTHWQPLVAPERVA